MQRRIFCGDEISPSWPASCGPRSRSRGQMRIWCPTWKHDQRMRRWGWCSNHEDCSPRIKGDLSRNWFPWSAFRLNPDDTRSLSSRRWMRRQTWTADACTRRRRWRRRWRSEHQERGTGRRGGRKFWHPKSWTSYHRRQWAHGHERSVIGSIQWNWSHASVPLWSWRDEVRVQSRKVDLWSGDKSWGPTPESFRQKSRTRWWTPPSRTRSSRWDRDQATWRIGSA